MSETGDAQKARLRWQCRRGMRELDDLLLAWMGARFDRATAAQKAVFERLLQLPDPDLASYLLLGQRASHPDTIDVIEQIRGQAES